ncbi:hypothetical protein PUNSTDRAFT_146228 [Punctularia strigosozonata HHB-11173 SS5]|uniref:Transcription factor domain-containing protein n=1 Tax=Punctularia strigosozonata (strain HHB-11173) TaxID=741275 RepID=R7S413_PUNST|nr:uncharacterized protein PUNSTDRAFT_146228 [Punctularia strigosozonata HHB-11173 SS5]EIN04953.1 hypothetical protein PUNSTDRAFT_146228 [Punctularia strigosozonata HHB-11173 SS5]
MTHIVPPHEDLGLAPATSFHPPPMDPALHQQQPQQLPPPHDGAASAGPFPPGPASKKRRKATTEDGSEPHTPAEPRRLRRSHEACARCRSKKIKASAVTRPSCDSKHPRCTACATAGTVCHQEDRHRQTLTPRGHTERIERQLLQCDALLKRHIPGFSLDALDEIIAAQGIKIEPEAYQNPAQYLAANSTFQFGPFAHAPPSGLNPFPYVKTEDVKPPVGQAYTQGGPSSPVAQGYPPNASPSYGPGYPMGHHYAMGNQYPSQSPAQAGRPIGPADQEVRGQDPQNYDISNTQALAKSFGVSPSLMTDIKLVRPGQDDREDLAVGSSGLSSGRDRSISEAALPPRDPAKWVSVAMRRRDSLAAPPPPNAQPYAPPQNSVAIWLPRDRAMVRRILDVYFDRLNYHRPVYPRREFEATLEALYEGQNVAHDPGLVCSFYLMLALGTLSELNQLNHIRDNNGNGNGMGVNGHNGNGNGNGKLHNLGLPADWPEHEEFFERALAVKPELRVTLSSLQALILLHWYLYTERQGRTLWRLVGSLVRLGIELGLHHDPTLQHDTFSEEECQLRIRLWGIVMMHDRGTSLLLGRPLAIAPFDSNTPRPSRPKKGQLLDDFSEHFLLSHPIVEIQADIINSLYTPTRQTGDAIMRHATRIMKSMAEVRRQLPEHYKWYFSGTEDWPLDRRSKLVQDITEDQGLTLLKIGITRILLLRALFSSKELQYPQRHRALLDAIVTSHNIIIVHNQLIRFPDATFFVSHIPLHIAAMVILYGHMSRCERLPRQVALEDVWMALDMLPRFRWRWDAKADLTGGHPLIAKLAERVLNVNLHQVGPPSQPVLISEDEYEPGMMSPTQAAGGGGVAQGGVSGPGVPGQSPMQGGSAPQTPHMAYGPAPYGGHHGHVVAGGPPGGDHMNRGQPLTPKEGKLAEVDNALFYPFLPEQAQTIGTNGHGGAGAHSMAGQDYSRLLAEVQHPAGPYGYAQSQEAYMLEEKDVSAAPTMWMAHEQKYDPRAIPQSHGMHS